MWKTWGLALGNSSLSVTDGDSVYFGSGQYREVVTAAYGGSASAITFIGDVDGAKTGDVPGEVQLTAYTTNDTTAPSASTTLDLAGKSFLTFQNISFVGGTNATAACLRNSTAVSHDITISDCDFFWSVQSDGIYWVNSTTPTQAANFTITRCRFLAVHNSSVCIEIDARDPNQAADVNINFTISQCVGSGGAQFVGFDSPATIANTGKPSGCVISNCTYVGSSRGVRVINNNWSTTTPVGVYNSIVIGGTNAVLQAAVSGELVENYNYLQGSTIRTNVSAGANSQTGTTYAPLFEIGQAMMLNRQQRPFMMPTIYSPFLAFGNSGAIATPTIDGWNRPRPSGGGSTFASASLAIGYLERHDICVKETTTVDVSPSIKCTGPGDHDLLVPVEAVSTTISIKVQRDANYGGGTKPQITLISNGEIGVTTQTVTDAGSASQWNTLTLSPFTPTAKGVVKVRLDATGSAGNGNTYWDTATVPTLAAEGGTAGFDFFLRNEPFPALTHDASGGGAVVVAPRRMIARSYTNLQRRTMLIQSAQQMVVVPVTSRRIVPTKPTWIRTRTSALFSLLVSVLGPVVVAAASAYTGQPQGRTY
jgi:hypothetical protein